MPIDQQIVFGFPLPGVAYTLRPAAYAVIVSEGGKIAVVQGSAGYWLPGGGTDAGETPEETVIREVMEELGHEIVLLDKLGTVQQYFIANDGAYRMLASFFVCALSGEPSGAGEHDLCWMHPDEAENRLYHECHAWAVRTALG